MAIMESALAHAMARDLVRAAPPEAGVKRIWVWSKHGHIDPERDYVELSVLHDPLDEETHQRFLSAIVHVLDERYPEANKSLHTFSSPADPKLNAESGNAGGALLPSLPPTSHPLCAVGGPRDA